MIGEDNIIFVEELPPTALKPHAQPLKLLALFMLGRRPSQHQVVRLIEPKKMNQPKVDIEDRGYEEDI